MVTTISIFVVVCFAAATGFEIVPLEAVSETSSNTSIGDLNGDGDLQPHVLNVVHRANLTSHYLGGQQCATTVQFLPAR
jgi:hypothetical protein